MKKILFIFSLFILSFSSFSQCTPSFIFTSLGLPGVYPPAIQIPNVPLPSGIDDGSLGSNYNQILTLIVLEDTSMDIGFLLPTSAVIAMNLAGISTTMTVDVNYVIFDVQGLPNGINSQCDISSCQYPSAVDGCISLNGTPTVAGTFPLDVNMTINIQVPDIAGIIPSMAFDVPAFSAVTYDLFISDATSIKNVEYTSSIYPNPTNSDFTIKINSPKQIEILNSLGQKVYSENVRSNITINKLELGTGIFVVKIWDNNSIEKHKLIIQ